MPWNKNIKGYKNKKSDKKVNNYTICVICNQKLKQMSIFHLRKHGLTYSEYIERYGSPILAQRKEIICPNCNKLRLVSKTDTRSKFCNLNCRIEYQKEIGSLNNIIKIRRPWNKSLTKEIDKRVAKSAENNSIAHIGKRSYLKGRTFIEVFGKEKAKRLGRNLSLCLTNKPCYYLSGNGRGGFREYLGHFIRSSWEANVCSVYIYNKIEYEYESKRCRFDLGNLGNLLLDTYLPKFDLYVEIKGYLNNKAKMKLKRFCEIYPEIAKKTKIIDGEVYKVLEEKYSSLIKTWEK